MELLADGRVRVRTPHHPQSGRDKDGVRFTVEMIRRLCAQIPDVRQHMTLYYGWYSHRARGERRKAELRTARVPRSAVEVRA